MTIDVGQVSEAIKRVDAATRQVWTELKAVEEAKRSLNSAQCECTNAKNALGKLLSEIDFSGSDYKLDRV